MQNARKLKTELDKIPKLQIFKRSELLGKINTLSEQIEELKSEKSMLLAELGCADDKDISKINNRIYDITEALAKMERHTNSCEKGIKMFCRNLTSVICKLLIWIVWSL